MSYYATPRRKRTKAENQKAHAKRRAEERFGINISISRVVKMIQNGESRCIRKQNNRLSHHKIVYEGKEMVAIYDRVRKVVTTFLYTSREEYEKKIASGEIL